MLREGRETGEVSKEERSEIRGRASVLSAQCWWERFEQQGQRKGVGLGGIGSWQMRQRVSLSGERVVILVKVVVEVVVEEMKVEWVVVVMVLCEVVEVIEVVEVVEVVGVV